MTLFMKKANFRLILFGLESANQTRWDILNKSITTDNMIADAGRYQSRALSSYNGNVRNIPGKAILTQENPGFASNAA